MAKNFDFYRCYLERGVAGDGEPGLLAATEVVQAVCDAGFHKNGNTMRDFPSSPHCYYKYAKPPKDGMYMMRAVKKTDMTSLDILIDTRLYPCFVIIEKHKDWQEELEEVKDTLEAVINGGAEKYNYHANLQEHRTNTIQYLEEFLSAMAYMKDQENLYEKHNGNIQIGQFIMKVEGDNYYNEKLKDGKIEKLKLRREDEAKVDTKERNEELFHFVHPEIEEAEAWRVHDAVKRVVAHQRVPDICAYLRELKQNGKLMLPSIPSVMYHELVRLGMPKDEGFSEKTFTKCYMK